MSTLELHRAFEKSCQRRLAHMWSLEDELTICEYARRQGETLKA